LAQVNRSRPWVRVTRNFSGDCPETGNAQDESAVSMMRRWHVAPSHLLTVQDPHRILPGTGRMALRRSHPETGNAQDESAVSMMRRWHVAPVDGARSSSQPAWNRQGRLSGAVNYAIG
jgi:hypothetical protein